MLILIPLKILKMSWSDSEASLVRNIYNVVPYLIHQSDLLKVEQEHGQLIIERKFLVTLPACIGFLDILGKDVKINII